jgi:hypothetical protein
MQLHHYIMAWQQGLAAGILLGRDYWARADAFIAKRLSGEIERGPGSSVEYCL